MTRAEILQTAKPILFNTEMVRAIQNGDKKVTRRPLKPHNAVKAKKCGYEQGSGLWYDDTFNEGDKDTHIKDYSVSCCWIGTKIYIQKYAPYKVGDILYVRETWASLYLDMHSNEIVGYIYKITKKSTGEFYVGQTQYAPVFRWGQHLKTKRFPIANILDYKFEVLEIVPKGENILEREKHYIQLLYRENPKKSLNIACVAGAYDNDPNQMELK